jgi:hypothetical protein
MHQQQSEVAQSKRSHFQDLDAVLTRGNFDPRDVRSSLDALSPEERLRSVRSLSGKAQARLFEAAQGAARLTLDDLVPAALPARTEVPHLGKNSLPAFTLFAKVFCRPEPGATELWGYNRSGEMIETFVGPGYYVAYESGSEVMIDYTRLPTGKLPEWPAILSNQARLSRFVYGGMIDALRSVSEHVSIGRAIRRGKAVDNWFVLCRSV